jgi:hypothetical protein
MIPARNDLTMSSSESVIFPSPEFLASHLSAIAAATTAPKLIAALGACSPEPSWFLGPEGTGASLSAALDGLADCSPQLSRAPFFAPGGLLSSICARASRLHAAFPGGLSLLDAAPGEVVLPRAEAATLVACMFLCVLPLQDRAGIDMNSSHFSIVMGLDAAAHPQAAAKLRCVLHYFARQREAENGTAATPPGALRFRRVVAAFGAGEAPGVFFARCRAPLKPPRCELSALIDDFAGAAVQADFANKYIGGGALRGGAVQEEIMFAVAPELFASMLIAPALRDEEALLMLGAERFSRCTGYSRTLHFAGDFAEVAPRSPSGEPATAIAAIDATCFFGDARALRPQLQAASLLRELTKAFAGFSAPAPELGAAAATVATGHWGCGAFGGHKGVKALVQWAAASAAGSQLIYCFFNEAPHLSALEAAAAAVAAAAPLEVTVGHLFRALLAYRGDGEDIVQVVAAAAVAMAAEEEAAAVSGEGAGVSLA